MGDEKLSKPVGLRLTPSLYKAVERKAEKMRLRIQDAIRVAISEYVKDEIEPAKNS